MIIRSKAPFRISFGGGGTDVAPYCWEHGGAVVNTTIDKYAYASLRTGGRKININSVDFGVKESSDLGKLEYTGSKLDFVKAVINQFEIQGGFHLTTFSDMPPGSGMGTSSSMAVALISCLGELERRQMSRDELARLAYHVEREELSQEGGYQDQYAATFGGLNYMEFFKGKVNVIPLHISPEILNELHYRLLLFYTGKTRFSGRIHKDMAKRSEKGERNYLERLEALKEVAKGMKHSLSVGNLEEFGELLHEGWLQKKNLSDRITTSQTEELYAAARKNGAIGGKILGAGGGGYLLLFCHPEKRFDVVRELTKRGVKPVSFGFEPNGVQTWRVGR